ncbi:hypothetical protein GCM10023093_27960 [Nemorincola caseinilytica]|uniref:Activator of Hsp90 ATPase homolog 1-like protein n=1 Tax=Nemorincola caseinilytica TaxID=2054315 RepID=A0ABP8NL34_9BACT
MQQPHYLVPAHTDGAEIDITHSLQADLVEEAEDLFVDAKNRLLDVTHWARYAGLADVRFALADGHRHTATRKARRGDHILIDGRGPGQPYNEYDAYTIEALEYDDYPDTGMETFAIRIHPSDRVATDNGDTATIVIQRNGIKVSAIYHGRNSPTGSDGLWHGMSNTEWEALMRGLIEYFD